MNVEPPSDLAAAPETDLPKQGDGLDNGVLNGKKDA